MQSRKRRRAFHLCRVNSPQIFRVSNDAKACLSLTEAVSTPRRCNCLTLFERQVLPWNAGAGQKSVTRTISHQGTIDNTDASLVAHDCVARLADILRFPCANRSPAAHPLVMDRRLCFSRLCFMDFVDKCGLASRLWQAKAP